MRLITIVLVTLATNVCSISFSSSYDFKGIDSETKIDGHFYPVANKNLVTFKRPDDEKIFEGLEASDSNFAKVVKVKVSDLSLKLKKGDLVYHFNLYDKLIDKYEIKEYLNVLLVSNPLTKDSLKTKLHWNEYYIILSDKKEEIEHALENATSTRDANGFAFIGSDFDFSNARFAKFQLSLYPVGKLPMPSHFWENTKRDDVRHLSLLNNVFFFNNEAGILVEKTGKESRSGGWVHPNFYSKKDNYLELIVLNKDQYLVPLNPGPFKYKVDFLLIEPDKPQYLKGEFERGW